MGPRPDTFSKVDILLAWMPNIWSCNDLCPLLFNTEFIYQIYWKKMSGLGWNGPGAVRTGLEWSWCCQNWSGMVLMLSGLGWNGPGAVRTGLEWSWCCQDWAGMVLMLSGLGWNGPGAVRTGLEWFWCCQDWVGMVLVLSGLGWNGPGAVRTGLEWFWCCQNWAGMVLMLSGLGWNGPGAVRTGLERSWCCQDWAGMVLMLSELGWNGPDAVRTGLEWSWCCQDWAGMVLMLSGLGWNGSDAVRTGLECCQDWLAGLISHDSDNDMHGASIDKLVQERRKSSALTMELHLSCTNPSVSWHSMETPSELLSLWGESISHQWIPLTKCQQCRALIFFSLLASTIKLFTLGPVSISEKTSFRKIS